MISGPMCDKNSIGILQFQREGNLLLPTDFQPPVFFHLSLFFSIALFFTMSAIQNTGLGEASAIGKGSDNNVQAHQDRERHSKEGSNKGKGKGKAKRSDFSATLTADERARLQQHGEAYIDLRNGIERQEFREELLQEIIERRKDENISAEMQKDLSYVSDSYCHQRLGCLQYDSIANHERNEGSHSPFQQQHRKRSLCCEILEWP